MLTPREYYSPEENLRLYGTITASQAAKLLDEVVDHAMIDSYLTDAEQNTEGILEPVRNKVLQLASKTRGRTRAALLGLIGELDHAQTRIDQMSEHANDCIERAKSCLNYK